MLAKKLFKIFIGPLIFILGISIVYALGELCCGDSHGGSATLCTGSEVCMMGVYHWIVNSTDCDTYGGGICEAPPCNYCNESAGCDFKIRVVNDGTYNFTLHINIYQSEDEYGSAVLGSPATSSSDRAVCISVIGDNESGGSNLKSFMITNLSSTSSIVLGNISTNISIDAISSAKTSDKIYWNFCPDGHTGACSSGSGMTGGNVTSWMYYTGPDSLPSDWAYVNVIDPIGSLPIQGLLAGALTSYTSSGGGNGEVIPEFSVTGIIAAIIVILAVALIVYKRKK